MSEGVRACVRERGREGGSVGTGKSMRECLSGLGFLLLSRVAGEGGGAGAGGRWGNLIGATRCSCGRGGASARPFSYFHYSSKFDQAFPHVGEGARD